MPSTCIKRVQARACDMFGCPPAGSSYIALHASQAQKGTEEESLPLARSGASMPVSKAALLCRWLIPVLYLQGHQDVMREKLAVSSRDRHNCSGRWRYAATLCWPWL